MSARSVERLGLAASFVVTVTAGTGCRDNKGPDGPEHEAHYSPPHISQDGAGNCHYMHGFSCPEGAMCNPPGPIPADCPESMRDGGSPTDPLAATKPGWVRIKEQFGVYHGSCSYTPDHFCPLPSADPKAQCEPVQNLELSCKEVKADAGTEGVPDGGKPGWHWVEPFSVTRAGGQCVRYEGFWCESAGCKLPAATAVDCKSGEPLVTGSTAASESAAPSSSASALVMVRDGLLNPKDAKGRAIRSYAQGKCFVNLPFPPLKPGEQRPPGSPPPSEATACPPEMTKPTFRQCLGGEVWGRNDRCECIIDGNPPPPPRDVPCP